MGVSKYVGAGRRHSQTRSDDQKTRARRGHIPDDNHKHVASQTRCDTHHLTARHLPGDNQKKGARQKQFDTHLLAAARRIANLYVVLRREYTGRGFRCGEPSRAFTCFLKLARILQEAKDQGTVIEPWDWIRAHFEVYGEATFTNRLIGIASPYIYWTYFTAKNAATVERAKTTQLYEEIELLEYMCGRWDATPDVMLRQATPMFPLLLERMNGKGHEATSFLANLSAETAQAAVRKLRHALERPVGEG